MICFLLFLSSRAASSLQDSHSPGTAGQPEGRRRQKTQAKRGEGVELRGENRFLKCGEEEAEAAGSARERKILVGLERPLELTAPAHHYVASHGADTPTNASCLSGSRHRHTVVSIPAPPSSRNLPPPQLSHTSQSFRHAFLHYSSHFRSSLNAFLDGSAILRFTVFHFLHTHTGTQRLGPLKLHSEPRSHVIVPEDTKTLRGA